MYGLPWKGRVAQEARDALKTKLDHLDQMELWQLRLLQCINTLSYYGTRMLLDDIWVPRLSCVL